MRGASWFVGKRVASVRWRLACARQDETGMSTLSDGSGPSIGTSSVGSSDGELGPGFRKLSNLCKGLGRRASGEFPCEPLLAVELRLAPVVGLTIRISVPRNRLPPVPGGSEESPYRSVENAEQETATETVRMRRHEGVAEG